MKIYKFTPHCEEYDFILEQGVDEEGRQYCHGIDIPCKDDAKWRFWTLWEENCVSWNFTIDGCPSWDLTDEEKEEIKEQATKYCLENGYTFNGEYFELH